MMKRNKRFIDGFLVCLMVLIQSSCVKELNLEDLRPDPKMVVNCVAVEGEPLRVSVSRTWFFTDDHFNILLEDAKVMLFVNDEFKEELPFLDADKVFNTKGYFESAFIPRAGDRIRIEVSSQEYGTAHAETSVPAAVKVTGATMSAVQTDIYNKWTAIYQVTFQDDPHVNNYYLLRLEEGMPIFDAVAKKYTGEYKWSVSSPNFATDPVFGQSFSALDQIVGNDWMSGKDGRVFSDELINGQEYTIRLMDQSYIGPMMHKQPFRIVPFSVTMDQLDEKDYLPVPLKMRIHLYEISSDYYWYLKVLQDQDTQSVSNSLIDAGLAEPIRVYSNIEGGLGILGGCNVGIFDVIVEKNLPSN